MKIEKWSLKMTLMPCIGCMHFKTSFFLFSSLLQPIFFMQPASLRHNPISMPQMQRPLSCAIGRECFLHALSASFLHDACTSIS